MMCLLNIVMRIIKMSCSSSTNLTPIALIDTTTSIHVILLNGDEWESISSSCDW